MGTAAVEPLIAALHSSNKWYAVRALLRRKNPRVTDPLVDALGEDLSDKSCPTRREATDNLVRMNNPRATSVMMQALQSADRTWIVSCGCYIPYIALRWPGSEGPLLDLLNQPGSTDMAQALLNSGNP